MGAVRHSVEKYLYAFGAWQIALKCPYKIAQWTGSNYHVIARIQLGPIANDAVCVHARINLADHIITNGSGHSTKTDNVSHASHKVDTMQHFDTVKSGKYVSREKMRLAPDTVPLQSRSERRYPTKHQVVDCELLL